MGGGRGRRRAGGRAGAQRRAPAPRTAPQDPSGGEVMTQSPLWGIGRLAGDGGAGPPLRMSGDDVRKDFKAAIAALQSLGVGAGDHVLFVSMLSEAVQVGPFELAVARLRARG